MYLYIFPSVSCKLSEFLISFITYFSCVVLFASSFFLLLYCTVVCGHWGKGGMDHVIKERKKRHVSPLVFFLTGKQVLFTLSLWPPILFFFFPLGFHLWFMCPPSHFPILFHTLVFSLSVSHSHSCCQYVLPILFTRVSEKPGVKI